MAANVAMRRVRKPHGGTKAYIAGLNTLPLRRYVYVYYVYVV